MSLELKAQSSLVRGEDKNVVIRLIEDDGTPMGQVYNMSNATDWMVLFPAQGGGAIVKTKDSGDVVLVNNGNALQVRLRAVDTKDLLLGDNLAVEVRVIDNGYTSFAQIENALTVRASLYPNV